MNKIFLIFIVACLTEQLKADVYTVDLIRITEGDNSLATLDGDSDSTKTVTFLNDVNQGDMKVYVEFFDLTFSKFYNTTLDDPCNMDSSTEEGTIAAILWGTLGIDSCPIKAGDYPSRAEKFNQTGILEETFDFVGDIVTLVFEPKTEEDKKYFKLNTNVKLIEEDANNEDDDKEENEDDEKES